MSTTPDIPLQQTRHSSCVLSTPEQGAYPCFPKEKLRHREGKHDLSLLPSFGLELGLRAPHREVPRSRPLTEVLAGKAIGEGTGPGHHRDSFLGPLPGPTGCFLSPTRTLFLMKSPHHLDLCSTVAPPGKPEPVLTEGTRPHCCASDRYALPSSVREGPCSFCTLVLSTWVLNKY